MILTNFIFKRLEKEMAMKQAEEEARLPGRRGHPGESQTSRGGSTTKATC